MNFKVGQKVVIKNKIVLNEERHTRLGLFIAEEMERFKGMLCTVYSIDERVDGTMYSLSKDGSYAGVLRSSSGWGWIWDNECLNSATISFK